MEYSAADPEIVKLVTEIANEHHTCLDGARIAVIMRERAAKHRGRVVLATASKPSAKVKPLLNGNYQFVICIAGDEWQDLTPEQRRAVVDHELCHCDFDDDGEPRMKAHDYEEFAAIVERHGMWRGDRGERMIQGALIEQGIEVGTIGNE